MPKRTAVQMAPRTSWPASRLTSWLAAACSLPLAPPPAGPTSAPCAAACACGRGGGCMRHSWGLQASFRWVGGATSYTSLPALMPRLLPVTALAGLHWHALPLAQAWRAAPTRQSCCSVLRDAGCAPPLAACAACCSWDGRPCRLDSTARKGWETTRTGIVAVRPRRVACRRVHVACTPRRGKSVLLAPIPNTRSCGRLYTFCLSLLPFPHLRMTQLCV